MKVREVVLDFGIEMIDLERPRGSKIDRLRKSILSVSLEVINLNLDLTVKGGNRVTSGTL